MKNSQKNILTGITTGIVTSILLTTMLFSNFVTGDSILEYIEDGGSVLLIIIYYSLLGIVLGGVVSFIVNRINSTE